MNLNDFKCVNENVSLDDYYDLYDAVRSNMPNPKLLALLTMEETINNLKEGKLWLYYHNEKPVCSFFYFVVTKKRLTEHNIQLNEKDVCMLGPIMVRKEYVGYGLMNQMLFILEEYAKNKNKKYIYVSAAKENIYSVRNLLRNGYTVVDEYESDRGMNLAFIKEIK